MDSGYDKTWKPIPSEKKEKNMEISLTPIRMAMNMFPMRFSPGLPIFGDDIEVVKQSWRVLLGAGAKMVYPSHGKAFSADVMRKAIA
jgi:hypothetical protein